MMYRHAAATCPHHRSASEQLGGGGYQPTCHKPKGTAREHLRSATAAGKVLLQCKRVQACSAVSTVFAGVDAQPVDQLQHLGAPAAQRLFV